MAHLYEVGTKAWQPNPTEGWIASELVSKTNDGDKYKLVFNLENGEVSPLSSQTAAVSAGLFRLRFLLMLTLRLPNPDQDHRDHGRGHRVGQ